MMIVVRPAITSRSADRISCSLVGSTDRRRVVEDQHPRVGEHGPGDRDPLPLPARQREPVLADHGVVPVGQVVDEVVRAGQPRRAAHPLQRRLGIGERDVVAHGVGEEERVLEHDADRAAEVAEPERAHVDAVDEDRGPSSTS